MDECFTEAGKLIATLPKEERKRLYEVFDRQSYEDFKSMCSADYLATINTNLQTTLKFLKQDVEDKKNAAQKEKPEEKQTQEKQEENDLVGEDVKNIFRSIKFVENDTIGNLNSMKKLPIIFRAILSSANVPGHLRKKYDGVDKKLEILTSKNKGIIANILCKEADEEGKINPMKLVVIVGELLTHKPKNQEKNDNPVEMKKE